MSYHTDIIDKEFQPLILLAQQQAITKNVGAQSIFVGYMRDFREETTVSRMTITHYSPMTERHLQALARQTYEEYRLIHLYVVHRVGDVFPTSPLVLIAATASHRANAIQATTFLLEQLKHNVPFWKKEYRDSNEGQWVQNNTPNALSSY